MLKYAFYLKLFVLIKHLSAGGEWADLELKMGILFSQIYLTKKCIVAAMYGFEIICHSVLFSILGLPLFEGRKNYHNPLHVQSYITFHDFFEPVAMAILFTYIMYPSKKGL